MADPKMRIRLPGTGPQTTIPYVSKPGLPAVTVSAGQKASVGQYYTDILPAKEWCIVDDMLTVSDSLSFTVANPDGFNTDKFQIGRLVEADISDDTVAGGNWCRVFTGRVSEVEHGSDIQGGSIIRVDAMDLGWHLTSCCARPLTGTNGITLDELIRRLVDSTWGFAQTSLNVVDVKFGNSLNRLLKQGRTGAERAFVPPKTILPYIQVEPGQTPWSILQQYCARAGLLVNVGANGEIILFQPDYSQTPPYATIEYHASTESARRRNNVVGRPSKRESLDGVYSEAQCWSTVVTPLIVQPAEQRENPNAQYRHQGYRPDNPLPFYRLKVDMDCEAINSTMMKNRAIWRYQMDAFNSWQYTCDVRGHSSRNPSLSGTNSYFWASDSMVSINDTVHNVVGTYYLQRVQRSFTMKEGARSKLTFRRPNLLDPSLTAQTSGIPGGTIRSGQATTAPGSTTTLGPGGQITTIPKVAG